MSRLIGDADFVARRGRRKLDNLPSAERGTSAFIHCRHLPAAACWCVMKTAILILGIAALLTGLLWVGQGTGFVHWPASSFMIDQRPWVTRGVVLALAGLVLIVLSRR
jgi:hypothetical protein